MLQVYSTCCKNCLFSENRIISPQRAASILADALQDDTYFICHAASMKGEEVVCRKFYEEHKEDNRALQIAQRLGIVEFVPQPEKKRLPSYNEMNKRRNDD